jgi:hypothetical protein
VRDKNVRCTSMTRPAVAALDGMQKIRADGEAATKEGVRFEASHHDVEREVRSGSFADIPIQ